MIAFANEIDWIYMFCRHCWTYQRFIFAKPIPWKQNIHIEGKCTVCQFPQKLDVMKATTYYENLNKDNK